MKLEDNPLIRRTLLPQPGPDPYAEPRARLWSALRQFRERAAMLANEIHRDLPEFTVHDITHLDALWEMADLIAGPDYPLNPLEAFALGGVFLLHDLGLGLAAWPGGLEELKKGPRWGDALSAHLRKHLGRIPTAEELASPPPEIERLAVADRLRALHAEQAERLALASWRHKGEPEYYLIDDPDLRQLIGPLLGKIAHSHWWPDSRLGKEFGMRRGALPDCPRDWELDPLKIAILLRTADAAHLDARRAPGFLLAFRRPEGFSEEHWLFQNHLLKPRIEEDRLVYTTMRPFPQEEASAWWLCEEILRLVDRELHQADALLADLNRPRFRIHGVAGTESSDRLQKYVEVVGWTPVDARIQVSNVADLVRRLGGEQLYGKDPTIPLRELIQNASDAVRARRILRNLPASWGHIIVRLGRCDRGPWVEVEDTGVGMSKALLSGPLLDFGATYWGSDLMKEEHEGLWSRGFEPVGRFGVGFFSVFMWGNRVLIATRRYREDAQKDTKVLEFCGGLQMRPLVRPAQPEEQLQDGGTRIRVWLEKEPGERDGLLYSRDMNLGSNILRFEDLCAGLAPALDVNLYVEDGDGLKCVVAASDWLTMKGSELIKRINFGEDSGKIGELFGSLMRTIRAQDGRVLGRATISRLGSGNGVVTAGGLRVGRLTRAWGIFEGVPARAARDSAAFLADEETLREWASNQASLIYENVEDPWAQIDCASKVVSFGGDPGNLPIIVLGNDNFLSFSELAHWDDVPEEVVLMDYYPFNSDVDIFSNVAVEMANRNLIAQALAQAWGCGSGDVLVRTEYEYVVGIREDGSPAHCEEVQVISSSKQSRQLSG